MSSPVKLDYRESCDLWRAKHPEWVMPLTIGDGVKMLQEVSRRMAATNPRGIDNPVIEWIISIDASWCAIERGTKET